MGRPVPLNDLDRAVKALARSTAALPDLYRRLSEGELCALVPYHPEVEDNRMSLENGSVFPFVRATDEDGEFVPIFSSPARLDESLRRQGTPARTFSCAHLPALDLLRILGAMEFRAVLNKGCATGAMSLPPDLLRDLANGRALAASSLETVPVEKTTLQYVPAVDRPTALVQTAFEVLRKHAAFQAAWVFNRSKPPAPPRPPWYFIVVMDPRDPAVFHDFNIAVTAAAARAGVEVVFNLVPDGEPDFIRSIFQAGQPFYLAESFTRPT